jgi:molybdopterin converting factor subunit 1
MDWGTGVSLLPQPEEIVVRVRLFAILREHSRRNEVELRLRSGATVADALRALAEIEPLGDLLRRLHVQMAVNRDYATTETVLAAGDELALIPPVSGGGAGPSHAPPHVRVGEEPLSIERVSRAVACPAAGAVVVFQGMTREVPQLEYEAYVEMALERIELIMRECIATHDLRGGAAEHRVGTVPLGEPSVIVAVSAAHRSEAFAGAREAIDRIKAEAPIWKREHAADGSTRWASG